MACSKKVLSALLSVMTLLVCCKNSPSGSPEDGDRRTQRHDTKAWTSKKTNTIAIEIGTRENSKISKLMVDENLKSFIVEERGSYSRGFMLVFEKRDFFEMKSSRRRFAEKWKYKKIAKDCETFLKEVFPKLFSENKERQLYSYNIDSNFYFAEASEDGMYRMCHIYGVNVEGEFLNRYPEQIKIRCLVAPANDQRKHQAIEISRIVDELRKSYGSDNRTGINNLIKYFGLETTGSWQPKVTKRVGNSVEISIKMDNESQPRGFYRFDEIRLGATNGGIYAEAVGTLSKSREIRRALHEKGASYGQIRLIGSAEVEMP